MKSTKTSLPARDNTQKVSPQNTSGGRGYIDMTDKEKEELFRRVEIATQKDQQQTLDKYDQLFGVSGG